MVSVVVVVVVMRAIEVNVSVVRGTAVVTTGSNLVTVTPEVVV